MSICENTNSDELTASQKAHGLHEITSDHDITYKQILARVNEERTQQGIQPLSYKNMVNRLALLRRGKYAGIATITLDSFLKAACQLVEQQIKEPQP
jgi:hypothetical protein